MAEVQHAHEDRTAYYLDQLFMIGVCGAVAGVTIMLWQSNQLAVMLDPKFHIWVALGGFGLLAIVALRAVAVWNSVEEPHVHEHGAECGHSHGHECGHDHGHSHAVAAPSPIVAPPESATAGHSHSHGHTHSHGDGHDHGWAPWRYVVLLLPVVLYFLVLANPAFNREPIEVATNPIEHIMNFIIIFRSILWEALPFIVLGAVIAGLLEEFLPQRVMVALLPRSRFAAIALGGLLGLVFPMCECGIIPIMRRLLRKGLPLSCCIAYLLAGPIINVVVLLSTYAAFSGMENFFEGGNASYQMGGLLMVAFRAGMGYVVAIITAMIVDWQYSKHGDALLTPLARPSSLPVAEDETVEKRPLWERISNVTETALHDFVDITVFLILGALLAASTRLFLTTEQVANLGREHFLLAILAMMGLAIVLCLCSEADAFVAASFATLRPSAKLAFLVLGPMMDFKLYFMYTRIFRPRLILTIYAAVLLQVFLYSTAVHAFWDTFEFRKALVNPQRPKTDTIPEKEREHLERVMIFTWTNIGTPVPGADNALQAISVTAILSLPTETRIPIIRFTQLENAAQSEEQRNYYTGRLVKILGRYVGTSDQSFTLTRFKINCCAADAQPIKSDIGLDTSEQQTVKLPHARLNGKWVWVTGRIRFYTRDGGRTWLTALIVKPTQEMPLEKVIEETTPPVNPYVDG